MKMIAYSLLALIASASAWADPPATQPAAELPWSQSANGMRVALQVLPPIWPLQTQDNRPFAIVLKLHVINTSDRPIRVVDWRRQPAALLLAYDSGKLVEWGGGSRVLVDPAKGEAAAPEVPAPIPAPEKNVPAAVDAPLVELAAGATCVVENTVQFDGGRLVWPILGGGVYHWPFKPGDKLRPGRYELRAGYENFGRLRGRHDVRSTVKITVVDKLGDAVSDRVGHETGSHDAKPIGP